MAYKCGICKQEGHSARTCPSKAEALKPAKSAKPAAEVSVIDSLETRLAKVRHEVETLERIIGEIRGLDS